MVFGRWRVDRDLERKAEAYVATLMKEPAADDVAWLARSATRGDVDHARWELRYARRALGLIVSQRDALDDKTASAVARILADAIARDKSVDANTIDLAETQFNARISAYRDGLESRGSGTPIPVRLGQTLFAFSGGAFRDAKADVARAGDLLTAYAAEANAALRATFGTAQLPEDIPPSAVGR